MQPQRLGKEPELFSKDDLDRVEEALRQLGGVQALIDRCKRCKIPVEGADNDCKDLCAFFHAILAEFRGPQGDPRTR